MLHVPRCTHLCCHGEDCGDAQGDASWYSAFVDKERDPRDDDHHDGGYVRHDEEEAELSSEEKGGPQTGELT